MHLPIAGLKSSWFEFRHSFQSVKTSSQEIASVAYIAVLDEIADENDTILHVINNLYVEYVCKHGKRYLVLEGDAKT